MMPVDVLIKRIKEEKAFFQTEKDSCVLLSMFGMYNRDFERAKYINHDEESADKINIYMTAIESILIERLKGAKKQ